LSEDSKLKRRRIGKVNIQMTAISWLLELFTGLVAMGITIHSQNPESDIDFIACIIIIDACLNFILIPSSYLLNNEVNKTMIIAGGWCRIFRRRVQRSNKVNPAPNNVERAQPDPNLQPAPIRTISGNVKALAFGRNDVTMENLNKDLIMLTANKLFFEP
jgi:hypothetical protein